MLMNAAASAATTVALAGGTLPDCFKDFIILAVVFGSIFSLPSLIRIIYNSVFGNCSKGE